MVHARRIDGRVLSFGHSGWLWRNAYLLYDRETDSLWHNATGIAMSGPMRGRRLGRFDGTAIMTWAAWRAEHPDTVVLAKPDDPAAPVETDAYEARDVRFSFGLAVDLPGAPSFYPFEGMKPLDAIEDDAAGTPVVVVRDAAAETARAFDRRVDGRTLSFDVVAGERPRLRQRDGGLEWYLRSGLPVPGSGAEAALCPLPATPFERGAWQAQHPAGSIRRRP